MRMTFTGSLSATLSPMITAGMVSCRGRVEDDRIELLDLFRPERDRGFESRFLQQRVGNEISFLHRCGAPYQ